MTLINIVAANQKYYAFNLLSVFIMVFWSVQYLLQHLLVQTQLSDQLLQPLILIFQLPQTPQFRHARPGKFFLPVNGMDYLLPLRLTVRNVFTKRITMNIVFLGIDLAKNVFQLCGLNQAGKPVYTKRTGRKELLQTLANIPACLIGIEASTGAFYWQREFEKLGHKVKVISPQYVKPFVRGQKNDGNDAQAIAVALMQPTMQFVPPKSPEQQDIQALHRARQRIVNHRTATVCQIRGLLLDRGIPIGSAVSRARRAIPLILEDAENGLSSRMRRTIAELYDLFNDLGRRIHFFDKEIETVFRQSEACQHIAKVKGIGPKTATAVAAAIGKGTEFKNGRHFAAWLGLVPRQHSSGDRQVLMNMTKKATSICGHFLFMVPALSSGLPRITMMVI